MGGSAEPQRDAQGGGGDGGQAGALRGPTPGPGLARSLAWNRLGESLEGLAAPPAPGAASSAAPRLIDATCFSGGERDAAGGCREPEWKE